MQQPTLPLSTFIYSNIRGLYPKTNQAKVPMLKETAHQEDALFLALTETHLNRGYLDAEIHIE